MELTAAELVSSVRKDQHGEERYCNCFLCPLAWTWCWLERMLDAFSWYVRLDISSWSSFFLLLFLSLSPFFLSPHFLRQHPAHNRPINKWCAMYIYTIEVSEQTKRQTNSKREIRVIQKYIMWVAMIIYRESIVVAKNWERAEDLARKDRQFDFFKSLGVSCHFVR